MSTTIQDRVLGVLKAHGYLGYLESKRGFKKYVFSWGELRYQELSVLIDSCGDTFASEVMGVLGSRAFGEVIKDSRKWTQYLNQIKLETKPPPVDGADGYVDSEEVYEYGKNMLFFWADTSSAVTHSLAQRDLLAFNPETGRFYPPHGIGGKNILGLLKRSIPDPEQRKDLSWIPEANIVFNPRTSKRVIQDLDPTSNREMKYINIAEAPEWLKEYERHPDSYTPRVSDNIRLLFEWLFTHENQREEVFDWIHHTYTSRSLSILVLVGPQGSGKTTLARLIESIVGSKMCRQGSQSFVEDKFNEALYNARLLTLEEVSLIEDKHIDAIKRMSNEKVSIEQKGVDPFTTHNHASLIITNNVKSSIKISAAERKFSIPEVSTGNINKHPQWKQGLEEFVTSIQMKEDLATPEIVEFGLWILNRAPKTGNQHTIKGSYFYDIVENGMSGWKSEILNFFRVCKPDDTYLKFEIFEDESSMKIREALVEEFLCNTSYRDIGPIAHSVPIPKEKIEKAKRRRVTKAFKMTDEFKAKYSLYQISPKEIEDKKKSDEELFKRLEADEPAVEDLL